MVRRIDIKGVLLALAIASPAIATGGGFTNMYLLGDSLSDQGNLFAATTIRTEGAVGIPRADHYYEGRFSNGENYADILARELELDMPLTPSIAGGSNFAFGGTRTDYNTVELDDTKPSPVDQLGGQGNLFPDDDLFSWELNTQVGAFFERGVVEDKGALYVVFSGSNDFADLIQMVARCNIFWKYGSPLEFEDFCTGRGRPAEVFEVVLTGINNAIATFVAAGAQEILVPNIPNLGVVPGFTAFGPQLAGLATQLTAEYNRALDDMLDQWAGTVNIIPLDTFSLLTEVVDDPAAFGFTNATAACYDGFVGPLDNGTECPDQDQDEYVFWDKEHPTTALHAVLAEAALASLAPDMIDYLSLQVSELDVKNKVKKSLNGKLDGASQKLAVGRSADDASKLKDFIEDAASKLGDFIEKVQAMQGKEIIMEKDALSMIMRAEKIIALLEAE
jgi:outer membrane lipase/esterase